jgi:uncharacterized protein YgbK (DUF1537 family)
MAQLNQADFETLWNGLEGRPMTRVAQPTPIQIDLSLTGILTQYMTMAAHQQSQGKISAEEYADLNTAVAALKTVLARINDSALVADAAAQNAIAIQQKAGSGSSSS